MILYFDRFANVVTSNYFFSGQKEEPKTLLAKLGLNDWKFALPIGLFVGLPAVSNEVSCRNFFFFR